MMVIHLKFEIFKNMDEKLGGNGKRFTWQTQPNNIQYNDRLKFSRATSSDFS